MCLVFFSITRVPFGYSMIDSNKDVNQRTRKRSALDSTGLELIFQGPNAQQGVGAGNRSHGLELAG